MDKIRRRDFLMMVGASGVGAGAGALLGESTKLTKELLVPQVVPPEDYSPGIATWYNTVCRQCDAGCGISVRTREGRAKKVEGNAVHPVNQGGTCSLGQANLNALYNPDRIRTPLKLSGEKGSGQYTEISWDEALTTLGGRLAGLKMANRGAEVYLLTGGSKGHLNHLMRDFMAELGSANYYHYDFNYPINLREANRRSFGEEQLPYYDIRNTDYLLSFGADYLATWLSPVHHSLSYGHLRQGRDGHRGKTVQVEARMSLSGANADEWVAAKPGSEGLLALAMAHAIVNGPNYRGGDKAAWVEALADYAPAAVAADTEVLAAEISRLADEFISHRPSLAIGGGPVANGTNAVESLIAINILNYVAGNLNIEGGLVFNSDPAIADVSSGRYASARQMMDMAATFTNGDADVVIVNDCNPVHTLPKATGFAEALGKVPFVVAMSNFLDETTVMADLILPMDAQLEEWGDSVPLPGVGFAVATVSQPVVSRIYDTRSAGDIILALAHQIGGETPAKLPWPVYEDYLKDQWRKIYEAQDGGASGFDAFWKSALEAGVWAVGSTGTAAREVSGESLRAQVGVGTATMSGSEAEYPFQLQPYLTQQFGDGRGANLPWVQELPDPMTSIVYGSWAELNPETAQKMGVREGDMLRIESSEGAVEVPAFIFPAIRPDVVAVPIGQGHQHYGRYAQKRGVNVLEILAAEVDDSTGALASAATRVKVTRTGERKLIVKTGGVSRTLGRQILGPDGGHA